MTAPPAVDAFVWPPQAEDGSVHLTKEQASRTLVLLMQLLDYIQVQYARCRAQ